MDNEVKKTAIIKCSIDVSNNVYNNGEISRDKAFEILKQADENFHLYVVQTSEDYIYLSDFIIENGKLLFTCKVDTSIINDIIVLLKNTENIILEA